MERGETRLVELLTDITIAPTLFAKILVKDNIILIIRIFRLLFTDITIVPKLFTKILVKDNTIFIHTVINIQNIIPHTIWMSWS